MISITLSIPVDVVKSMERIALQRGFSGYLALLKAYLSEGLRCDEAQLSTSQQPGFVDSSFTASS